MASHPLPQTVSSRARRWMIDHDHAAILARGLNRALGRIWQWQERARQRHMLRGLDDHQLKDIGRSRAEAAR